VVLKDGFLGSVSPAGGLKKKPSRAFLMENQWRVSKDIKNYMPALLLLALTCVVYGYPCK
jgi:hypothetical protein